MEPKVINVAAKPLQPLPPEKLTFIAPGWRQVIAAEFLKPYMDDIRTKINVDKAAGLKIFPSKKNIFRCMHLTDLPNVKVVIIGQDPYPTAGHATGLAFGVPVGTNPLPPSLRNILAEMASDLNVEVAAVKPSLESWALQGVLLINTSLTVVESNPTSHSTIGWKTFTEKVISHVMLKRPVVYILWGSHAKSTYENARKLAGVNSHGGACIVSPHPSPLAAYRGFIGSKPFSRANDLLDKLNMSPVEWGRTS